MKKFGLLLLAVVMVAGMVGCNDDDGGDVGRNINFDFNGHWIVSSVKYEPYGGCNLSLIPRSMTIVQNGASVVITDYNGEHTGVANSKTGAIAWATGKYSFYGYGGQGTEHMYGTIKAGCLNDVTWTADLVSR